MGKINPIIGFYIPIIRIPIKGGMTIPNIATFDHGTYGETHIWTVGSYLLDQEGPLPWGFVKPMLLFCLVDSNENKHFRKSRLQRKRTDENESSMFEGRFWWGFYISLEFPFQNKATKPPPPPIFSIQTLRLLTTKRGGDTRYFPSYWSVYLAMYGVWL